MPRGFAARNLGCTRTGFPPPAARLGFRPNEMWNFGLSGSIGSYFEEEAKPACSRAEV